MNAIKKTGAASSSDDHFLVRYAQRIAFSPMANQRGRHRPSLHELDRAVALYAEPETMQQLRQAGMTRDFSWGRSCEAYEALYRKTISKAL